MTIMVRVRRHAPGSGSVDLGNHEFVTMPREGEIVAIDGTEGEVQRVEHLIAPGKPPEVMIFIDR
jgi:hypothetical protein